MIIYGTRGKQLKGAAKVDYTCKSCESNDSYAIGTLRYFHVFWIPFLVFKKLTYVRCAHCMKTIEYRDIPLAEQPKVIDDIYSFKRTGMYNFGVFALILMIVSGIVISFF